jgi:uncharacterized protein YggU (UPF0235/DUF167 family)
VGARLAVRVTPRAGADRVGPFLDGELLVRVTRPPADGEANEAVRRLVAAAIGLPPSAISLVAGARSRRKRFAIGGISEGELAARLTRLAD